jgi:hypothetical protein
MVKDVLKTASNVVNDGHKAAACYENAFQSTFRNPTVGLKQLWKCIKGGK